MAAMSAAPGRFDALLTSLAQQHGGVESLLDSFFDFLHRRTDFYVVARDPKARGMGFLPGQAQEKVLRAFHKFPMRYLDGEGPAAGKDGSRKSLSAASGARSGVEAAIHTPAASVSQSARNPAVPAPVAPAEEATRSSPAPVQLTEEGKQVPVGNGGTTGAYTWTQTLADVSVQVELPQGTKAKDLDCKITASHIRVALKPTGDAGAKVLLEGELHEKIRADESIWSIESQRTLLISLEKTRETWWPSVVRGDPEIDTTKVDSTRRIDEYDPATQGQIRKIVYEQRQQQASGQGQLPMMTPEEQLLAQAKNLPGSPFV